MRLYDGTFMEVPNTKESFRREEANIDQNGKILGWQGTRGIHSRKVINYISLNRDEFPEIKKVLKNPKDDSYYFFDDLIFSKLK